MTRQVSSRKATAGTLAGWFSGHEPPDWGLRYITRSQRHFIRQRYIEHMERVRRMRHADHVVVAAEYGRVPLAKRNAPKFGVVLLERGNRAGTTRVVDFLAEELRQGRSVSMGAEGRLSPDGARERVTQLTPAHAPQSRRIASMS